MQQSRAHDLPYGHKRPNHLQSAVHWNRGVVLFIHSFVALISPYVLVRRDLSLKLQWRRFIDIHVEIRAVSEQISGSTAQDWRRTRGFLLGGTDQTQSHSCWFTHCRGRDAWITVDWSVCCYTDQTECVRAPCCLYSARVTFEKAVTRGIHGDPLLYTRGTSHNWISLRLIELKLTSLQTAASE